MAQFYEVCCLRRTWIPTVGRCGPLKNVLLSTEQIAEMQEMGASVCTADAPDVEFDPEGEDPDLSIELSDPAIALAVERTGTNEYTITCTGEVTEANAVDGGVYPTAPADAFTVTVWNIPHIAAGKTYTSYVVNDGYEAFAEEPEVSYDAGLDKWTKKRNLSGDTLANGIMMILIKDKGDNVYEIYEGADVNVKSGAAPVVRFIVKNELNWPAAE